MEGAAGREVRDGCINGSSRHGNLKAVSLTRLGNVKPGRLGIFSGSLQAQPASVQREVAAEMEQLGYGTLWYGESAAREAFAQAAILLSAPPRLVVASALASS